jgi:hypothetical protein
MSLLSWVVLISAAGPLYVALRSNRTTTLFHAVLWAVAAWLGWILAAASQTEFADHFALALTSCAGVAVFGARRPGLAAWNFVVLGLLVVLLLPLGEAAALGTPLRVGTIRTVFLASLIGTTVINYLPTRLVVGAVLISVGATWDLACLASEQPVDEIVMWCVGFGTWLAWICVTLRPATANACDRLWRSFRDRFGLVWSQRVREQFNRATVNAGLDVELRWTGMRTRAGGQPNGELNASAFRILAAIVQRFGLP